MPVVTAIVRRDTDRNIGALKMLLEEGYQTAWTSLGPEFRDEDICSLVCLNPAPEVLKLQSPVTVIFYYNDRGPAFRTKLYIALWNVINKILIYENPRVLLAPVDPNHWSADPVWSQAPCTLPHKEGLTPSGYDDGVWSW